MIIHKNYRAIVMSMDDVDTLMKTIFDVDGEIIRRGDALSYHIQFHNKNGTETFLEKMLKLNDEVNGNIFCWSSSADVTEPAATELLAKKLGVNKIRRLLVDGDDQIILVDEERN